MSKFSRSFSVFLLIVAGATSVCAQSVQAQTSDPRQSPPTTDQTSAVASPEQENDVEDPGVDPGIKPGDPQIITPPEENGQIPSEEIPEIDENDRSHIYQDEEGPEVQAEKDDELIYDSSGSEDKIPFQYLMEQLGDKIWIVVAIFGFFTLAFLALTGWCLVRAWQLFVKLQRNKNK